MAISDEKLGDFLDRLADRVPVPGGGATAALHAAQGAALLGMVARYTTGEKYAEHAETIGRIITEVDELRGIALRLADADADAFTAVAEAYGLPKSTDEEKAARSAIIGQALVGAAAAESARAAAATARVNVEINLAGITDEQASLEMIAETGKADDIIALAEQVTAAVREQIRA